jgi:hypothetical protein
LCLKSSEYGGLKAILIFSGFLSSSRFAEDIWRSLTLHVFPSMKSTPLSELNAPMVIKLLRPIEAKGSLETVKRVSQRLNEIMT